MEPTPILELIQVSKSLLRKYDLRSEIASGLCCAVDLAHEVVFRNVVRIMDDVITADRYRVGLEPTS